jgi:thioredoxin reductase (NADPH)
MAAETHPPANGHTDAARADEPYDVVVVGAGPTGLFALFYAGMLGLRAVAVDTFPAVGGALSAIYPEKDIFDVPGFARVRAAELVRQMEEQALLLGGRANVGETVAQLERRPDGLYLLHTDLGAYLTRTVAICTGIGSFKPRKLPLATAEAYEGRGVTYLVTRPEELRDKRVVVVGGGDSALDLALQLHPFAQQVTLVHRSAWRAHEASVEALARTTVRALQPGYEVVAVHGNSHLEAVDVQHRPTKQVVRLETDVLLPAIGFLSDLGAMREWGLVLDGDQIVVEPGTMATNLPGVYAAGDVVTYPGKLKLIATGTAEAAQAVAQAARFNNPTRKLGAMVHSSNDPRFVEKKPAAAGHA